MGTASQFLEHTEHISELSIKASVYTLVFLRIQETLKINRDTKGLSLTLIL